MGSKALGNGPALWRVVVRRAIKSGVVIRLMQYLLDTNILLRFANTSDAAHDLASKAVELLFRRKDQLFVTPQVLIEFWNAGTRPVAVSGLGMSLDEAVKHIQSFEVQFQMLAEPADVWVRLKSIGTSAKVIGKQIHDARLVAICHLHSIPNILTFNGRHFARFAAIGPGLNIVEPATVLTPAVTKPPSLP